jgi:hypothetical protein
LTLIQCGLRLTTWVVGIMKVGNPHHQPHMNISRNPDTPERLGSPPAPGGRHPTFAAMTVTRNSITSRKKLKPFPPIRDG